jgi:hypothetical protein
MSRTSPLARGFRPHQGRTLALLLPLFWLLLWGIDWNEQLLTPKAAVAYVGGATNTVSTGTSVTATYTSTTGNCVVVHVMGNPGSTITATASGGATITSRVTADNGTKKFALLSTAHNGADGSTSFTATQTGSNSRMYIIVEEYSGAAELGTTASNNAGSGTDPTIVLTTQDANNFVVAGLYKRNSNNLTAVTGNVRHERSDGSSDAIAGFDNTAASATAVTNTGTSAGSVAWMSVALELRSTTGGSPQTLSPSAIATAQAFGSGKLNLAIIASAIATAQTFGTVVLSGTGLIQPSSIGSAQTFGTASAVGNQSITVTALSSQEAFGTPSIVGLQALAPSGIDGAEAFGIGRLNQQIVGTGIATGEAFGTTALIFGQTIAPSAIASAEAFGNCTLTILVGSPVELLQPVVVWSRGASILTWSGGVMADTPHEFSSFVVREESVGGTAYSYNMGPSDTPEKEFVTYVFPGVAQGKLDEFTVWRKTVSVGSLNPFTHTDNTEHPADIVTVYLDDYHYHEEDYNDPAAPSYEVTVRLQKA